MVYSLAERGEAPRVLTRLNRSKAPALAVLASVAFGIGSTVLELFFPGQVPSSSLASSIPEQGSSCCPPSR